MRTGHIKTLADGTVCVDDAGDIGDAPVDGLTYGRKNAAWEAVGGGSGWQAGTGTWSWSSSDAPTYVISVDNDQTGIVGVGQRIKLTHAGVVKYFIVTAVGAFGAGVTLITVYGGTDYTLANTPITLPYWSNIKAPLGFPLNPAKWTVEVSDNVDRTQAAPAINTWYNLGGESITVPIGLWDVEYSVVVYGVRAVGINSLGLFGTISTVNNAETDSDLTGTAAFVTVGNVIQYLFNSITRHKPLSIAAKTIYYLNEKLNSAGMDTLGINNASHKMIMRAVCAYL
jgi:hypothetical protein